MSLLIIRRWILFFNQHSCWFLFTSYLRSAQGTKN